MRVGDTIVALSSGSLPSGVGVIRISGPKTNSVLEHLVGKLPAPRHMTLCTLADGADPIDSGLIVYFPAPHSFTGEACAELQVHGSVAVIKKLLGVITRQDDVRLAEAGEFTRRAFDNGQLDLVEAEGLSDLIDAQTESQRQQAFRRMDGALSRRVDDWRHTLLDLRAQIEARLDFSDESDVDLALPSSWLEELLALRSSIGQAVEEIEAGRIVRDGYRVALAGPPNAGKSSLLNALARSDLAIVSEEAGTTRDVKEVSLDLNGQLVVLIDLAGLRESDSIAEAEGVRRAGLEIDKANLVLWLQPVDLPVAPPPFVHANVWTVRSKCDLGLEATKELAVSTKTGTGIASLLAMLGEEAHSALMVGEAPLVSHLRDREALTKALIGIDGAVSAQDQTEIAAEGLRMASDSLARLVGAIDAEHILDQLFSRFCIGK